MSTIPIPDLLTPAPQQHGQPLSASLVVQPSARTALEEYKKKDPTKIIVRFKSIGNAPIMKDNYFKITASNKFQAVIVFLRQRLGMKTEPLFTYINSSFSPAPDDTVANLFKVSGLTPFGSRDGE